MTEEEARLRTIIAAASGLSLTVEEYLFGDTDKPALETALLGYLNAIRAYKGRDAIALEDVQEPFWEPDGDTP